MTRSLHFGNDTDTTLFGKLDNLLDILGSVDVARGIGTMGGELRVLLGNIRERG